MAVAWPSQLPQYLNTEGFSFEAGSSVIESQNEIGPSKRRRVTTKPIDTINASMDMTKTQVDFFRTFFDVTLNAGLTSFNFNDPFTNTPAEYLFRGQYRVSPKGNGGEFFVVSFQWEIVP